MPELVYFSSLLCRRSMLLLRKIGRLLDWAQLQCDRRALGALHAVEPCRRLRGSL